MFLDQISSMKFRIRVIYRFFLFKTTIQISPPLQKKPKQLYPSAVSLKVAKILKRMLKVDIWKTIYILGKKKD